MTLNGFDVPLYEMTLMYYSTTKKTDVNVETNKSVSKKIKINKKR